MTIQTFLNEQKALVEKGLETYMLPATGVFLDHIQAMRYSLFAGGKRIRPILCLAAARTVNEDPAIVNSLLPTAVALECIHTYSLIHDDLPAMDNDDLRRGKATNHIKFGEAEAILAGDGLLTFAFELLTDLHCGLDADKLIRITHIIARASGSIGMVGGQALDIEHENSSCTFDMLKTIHKNKTGALILASIQAGATGGGAMPDQLDGLNRYGENIGLAFQIVDDLLNATATTEQLGKAAGSDAAMGKATYPSIFGIDETRKLAMAAVDNAKTALEDFDHRAEPLRQLADYVYSRSC